MIVEHLGLSSDLFVDFDPKPVGVASLAHVHVARLRDTGEKVAVKVGHFLFTQVICLMFP